MVQFCRTFVKTPLPCASTFASWMLAIGILPTVMKRYATLPTSQPGRAALRGTGWPPQLARSHTFSCIQLLFTQAGSKPAQLSRWEPCLLGGAPFVKLEVDFLIWEGHQRE